MYIIYYKDNGEIYSYSSTMPDPIPYGMAVLEVSDSTDIDDISKQFYYVENGELKFRLEDYRVHKIKLLKHYVDSKLNSEGYYSETFKATFHCLRDDVDNYEHLIQYLRETGTKSYPVPLMEHGETMDMTPDDLEKLCSEIRSYVVQLFDERNKKHMDLLNAQTKEEMDKIIEG